MWLLLPLGAGCSPSGAQRNPARVVVHPYCSAQENSSPLYAQLTRSTLLVLGAVPPSARVVACTAGAAGALRLRRDRLVLYWLGMLQILQEWLATRFEPRPMMSKGEIAATQAVCSLFDRPLRVLEWGSGYSTSYFPKRLTAGSTWDAIEHDESWAGVVARNLSRWSVPGAQVHFVPASQPFVVGRGIDGTEAEFAAYVSAVERFEPGVLDVALVDGRARVACTKRVWPRLAEDGVAILDDANRPHYADAIPDGAAWVALRDTRKLVDGTPVTVVFFFKSPAMSERFEAAIAPLRSRKVEVWAGRHPESWLR